MFAGLKSIELLSSSLVDTKCASLHSLFELLIVIFNTGRAQPIPFTSQFAKVKRNFQLGTWPFTIQCNLKLA